jgi:pyruvate/2-oxoglutarate/acetoin dehydrogenase E1 component
MRRERVADNLNRALHRLFEDDPRVYLLGEDILDPYGGAFKISKHLSTRHPDRIIGTPLSESGMIGVANGLALCGDKAIVEIMFGDFIALGFDQILNFAAKSVSMYGRGLPMHLLIRCPVGGNRGYGPTHSQCLQKHFIGIPHLALFELSPFHDNQTLLPSLLAQGQPVILFEDKVLYTRPMCLDGVVDDLFRADFLDREHNYARVFIDSPARHDCLVIAPGGLTDRAVAAARELFIRLELTCQIIVPSRLYPFDLEPLIPSLRQAKTICIVEDGTGGATWGSEVAQRIYQRLWGELRKPVLLVNSQDSIVPTARHLEAQVLVQSETIYRTIREGARA